MTSETDYGDSFSFSRNLIHLFIIQQYANNLGVFKQLSAFIYSSGSAIVRRKQVSKNRSR